MISKTIKVDQLARVEGEGALKVVVRDGVVQTAELNIFEPPRFFEAFLRDRMYSEAPDITARICGICPVAYQMSAVHAMEDALGVAVDGPLRDLRRLLYCGEWIESHTLHVYMLHAPDFLGYEGAIEMARDHADIVQARPRAQEGRQCDHGASRRPRDPSDQCPRRRLLPRAAPSASFAARRRAEACARQGARDRALDGRLRLSRCRARL